MHFLNVDLLLFDREPLLAAIGDKLFVLHHDAVVGRKKCVVLEVASAGLDPSDTLAHLTGWVENLPRPPRRGWNAASRRLFDIGIQAGLEPHQKGWSIPQGQVAALAKVGAEVAVTIYGAQGMTSRPSSRKRPRR